MAYFIFNGKFYQSKELVAGPGNRGLRYGDGIFETIKFQNNKLILPDEHFARLWKGMQVLGFDIPKLLSPEKFTDQILSLVLKNGHQNCARIRLQVFRGDGGLYDTISHTPNYVIESWPLTVENILNSNGLELGIYSATAKSCDILSTLKHCNFLPYVLASLYAKKEKWNDALLLNQYGRICDSTIANVFAIAGNSIITPALSEGCIAGIMRNHIIGILKHNGWAVEETSLTPEDLLQADEVFLTNSIYIMRWVKQLQNKTYQLSNTQKIYSLVLPTIV